MSYVQRDEDGLIVGVYSRLQLGLAEEFVENATLHKSTADIVDERRREEYEKEGVTMEAMVIALWEGDPATIIAMEAKRQAVKARVPK